VVRAVAGRADVLSPRYRGGVDACRGPVGLRRGARRWRGQLRGDDLDAHVAAIAVRGLEPDERETYPNGVRKALYRDPDSNELGFGGAPLDTGS
jgi:hypothetical protein